MRTIITYSVWAAAFALVNGVRLVDTVPGDRVGFVLDDSDGRATWAVIQWRQAMRRLMAARSSRHTVTC